MPRIRFTRHYQVQAAAGASYQEGQEIDCSDASANHFISRGVAVRAMPAEAAAEDDGGKKAKGKKG